MPWAPVLLTLLAHCTGCVLQPVLHQPPSESSSLGTTLRLACTLSSDYDVSLYNIYWYQQTPGQPPRFLLRFFSPSNMKQGAGVPPRFSASKDVARNTGYLSISQLQAQDEAVYYCAVGHGSLDSDREVEQERGEDKEPAASGTQPDQDMLN
ncbi:immunoglobulin iota chain-like [Tenrec ecaudatus]|uniref:immunoglobulin iota chain-like n=1 Tax=Tenrec ecaudatus TaxID=94439 RepID=UPI003F5958ED